MDKLIQAISETLAKLGLDEDTVKAATEEILSKAEGEPSSEEGAPSDVNPPEEPNPGDVPPADESASAGPQEDVPPADLPPSDTVPPVDGVGDVPPEVPGDLPPEGGDVPPAVPPFDPTELLAKMDELQKANEGLIARVQSLEEALKTAGVVDESAQSQVGDDTPNVPGEPSDTDIFNEQLKFLNGRKVY